MTFPSALRRARVLNSAWNMCFAGNPCKTQRSIRVIERSNAASFPWPRNTMNIGCPLATAAWGKLAVRTAICFTTPCVLRTCSQFLLELLNPHLLVVLKARRESHLHQVVGGQASTMDVCFLQDSCQASVANLQPTGRIRKSHLRTAPARVSIEVNSRTRLVQSKIFGIQLPITPLPHRKLLPQLLEELVHVSGAIASMPMQDAGNVFQQHKLQTLSMLDHVQNRQNNPGEDLRPVVIK